MSEARQRAGELQQQLRRKEAEVSGLCRTRCGLDDQTLFMYHSFTEQLGH